MAATEVARTEHDEEAARAVRYSRTREALFLVDLVWSIVTQAAFYLLGGSSRMRVLAERLAPRPWAVDAVYLALYALLARAIDLPLSYYQSYVVEHRYGLSNQNHRGWLVDLLKGTALGLVFELPIGLISYATIRRSPQRWWLILSGLALPFTVLLAQLYPVLIAPIFNKFVPLKDRALGERLIALSERAGVPVAEVTQMDMSRQTRKANAFFAGIGRTRRIALGDTLVEQFTPDEVEVVIAHELGHQVHRDVWKAIALSSVATLGCAYLVARFAGPAASRTAGRSGVEQVGDVASMPLLRLLLTGLSLGLMPLANGFTRRFVERPADRYALELTNQPDAFISGMERLGRLNLSDPNPPKLIRLILHSHPTIAERVAAARAFAASRPR
jgi:STE24 endopeptidase